MSYIVAFDPLIHEESWEIRRGNHALFLGALRSILAPNVMSNWKGKVYFLRVTHALVLNELAQKV